MLILVLKIPKGKLPYIGIRYVSGSFGESENKEFFIYHIKNELRLVIEVMPMFLTVKLICNDTLRIKAYTHVKYDPEKLANWLYISNGGECNFGITVLEKDQDKLLKVWDKKFVNLVVRIKSVNVLQLKSEEIGIW